MDFYEVVDKVVDLLCRRGRLTYSTGWEYLPGRAG
jgi:hypothetical protein